MQTHNQILVVMIPCETKDEVVDILMGLECISGFNLNLINGYSQAHSQFDISEQVEGYRKLYRFEVLHKNDVESKIMNALRSACSKAQARYWILPVNSEGHF